MPGFITAAGTDVGRVKKVNQDAVLIEEAETDRGDVLFAVVADGMGGLSMGEMASARITGQLAGWFENSLAAAMCRRGEMIDYKEFQKEMGHAIRVAGNKIREKATEASGTTVTGILLYGGRYYTVHVGDTRAYRYSKGEFIQMTKDQTYVQREWERGHISEAEMETHPKRSMLLQCVGASSTVIPEFREGRYRAGDVFLLCSDGFRHKNTREEMEEACKEAKNENEETMGKRISRMIHDAMSRGERDNITAILIRAV